MCRFRWPRWASFLRYGPPTLRLGRRPEGQAHPDKAGGCVALIDTPRSCHRSGRLQGSGPNRDSSSTASTSDHRNRSRPPIRNPGSFPISAQSTIVPAAKPRRSPSSRAVSSRSVTLPHSPKGVPHSSKEVRSRNRRDRRGGSAGQQHPSPLPTGKTAARPCPTLSYLHPRQRRREVNCRLPDLLAVSRRWRYLVFGAAGCAGHGGASTDHARLQHGWTNRRRGVVGLRAKDVAAGGRANCGHPLPIAGGVCAPACPTQKSLRGA